jgi:hypothetical protein
MPDIKADISIRITVLNPQHQLLGGTVDIEFQPQDSGPTVNVKAADASKNIDVVGLQRTPQGLYQITVTPTDLFKPTSQFATIPASGFITVEFIIDKGTTKSSGSSSPYKIPDTFSEKDIPAALTIRLVGTPANGAPATPSSTTPSSVIWVNGCSEVLVHLDSTSVKVLDGLLLISVDLETDQTGRTPLICAFAVSSGSDPAGLIATTDEYPRGDGSLAASWGQQLQQALWSSLLSLANDHASERGLAPRSISATAGTLKLTAGAAITLNAA